LPIKRLVQYAIEAHICVHKAAAIFHVYKLSFEK